MVAKKSVAATVGDRIDELGKINEELATLNKQLADLKKIKDEKVRVLMDAMREQGLTRSGGKAFTASVTTSEVPQVVDWDKFYNYILKNKACHLLQRRVAEPAMREVWELRGKRPVPGINKVELEKLSFRKA